MLDSLYRGYPAGSVLLWDTMGQIVLRDLATELGKNLKSDFIPKIVIDGQQRITSLGRVFDMSAPKEDRILFNVMEETFEPYSPRNAADPRWTDTTRFLTDEISELDVLDQLEEAEVIDRADREGRKEMLARLKRLAAIREYQFPVEIVREDDLEVITEVFIRINSGGTRLRDAELALARLAWKLPGSIVGPFEQAGAAAVERGFDLDTRFLMRLLISVATRQSRFRDLKAFWVRPAEKIEQAWNQAEKGLRLALDFVEGNVGIPGSELLASHLSLIPLAVLFSTRNYLTGSEERVLRRWFLLANAFSRYVGASETKLNQDLAALGPKGENVQGLLDLTIQELRGEPIITARDLERGSTNSPFFPLAYLAVIRRDAKDWFRGIKIRRDSFSEDQQIEYHHIFPKKHLDARNVDRYLRDEMANLAFLTQKANRRILTREPADYLEEIAKNDEERLHAQFIPMDRGLWKLNRLEDFLTARRMLLADAMNDVLAA